MLTIHSKCLRFHYTWSASSFCHTWEKISLFPMAFFTSKRFCLDTNIWTMVDVTIRPRARGMYFHLVKFSASNSVRWFSNLWFKIHQEYISYQLKWYQFQFHLGLGANFPVLASKIDVYYLRMCLYYVFGGIKTALAS